MSRLCKVMAVAMGLLLALILAGPGMSQSPDDDDNVIWIPEQLTTQLAVQAAYDDENVYFYLQWPTDTPHFYHDYLVYEDGQWVRYGASPVGSQEFGVYEDRVTFLVDDGSVYGFKNQGCYVTCHDGLRFMSDAVGKDEVQRHAYLGEVLERDDVRKYLPQSRAGENWYDAPWDIVESAQTLSDYRANGVFLDFWHWRAHRGNPIGYADDQYVMEFRSSDEGKGPYTTNWDNDLNQPKFMFNPQLTGQYALRWEKVVAREYTQDDYYYLSEEIAMPFDLGHPWQEGDVIPRRLLREPDGSHGTIRADGRWSEGLWHVELVRALDTGYPMDDKPFLEGRTYTVGFAIHKNATGSRWHYISFPLTLGIGQDADVTAMRLSDQEPDWEDIKPVMVDLFYPGQTDWEFVTSDAHPGAEAIRIDDRGCGSCHQSALKMGQASVALETRDEGNWAWTVAAGVLVIVGGSITVLNLQRRKN